MEADFWHDRWAENKIGFHQQEANTYLKVYWPKMNLAKGAEVFVPLCGKSLDLLWLSQQGFKVIGVEISKLAVESFFAENKQNPTISKIPGFQVYQDGDIKILCGDFFRLNSSHLGSIDAVFDRASLIALPAEMRRRYADHTQSIVPERTPILLVTLEYSQNEMDGPPFAVSEREIRTLYHGAYQVVPLHKADLLADNPRLRDRGLTALSESVCMLIPPV